MIIENTIEQEPFLWIDFKNNNFEHFKKVVHEWKIDFLQLDGGTFYSEVKQMVLPEVQIAHTKFDCHLDQKGTSPEGMWSFVIMDEKASMYQFHHEMTKSTSTMVIYTPGAEINGVSFVGFNVYILSVTDEHLRKLMQMLGLDMAEKKLLKIDRVELEPEQAKDLRELLRSVLRNAADMKNKMITAEEKKLILDFLPVKFLKEIAVKIGCAKEKTIKEKHFLYLEARAYMHMYLHEPLNIDDIANKFKLSGRTLRNYFQEQLNISPKQYLIALRLTKIRDELLVLDKKTGLVEKTARRFGFQHMGQFSKAYKAFFGELPSETLSDN